MKKEASISMSYLKYNTKIMQIVKVKTGHTPHPLLTFL